MAHPVARCAEGIVTVVLGALVAGCVGGGSRRPAHAPWHASGFTGAGIPHDVPRYRPLRPRRLESAAVMLPGSRAPRLVRYEVVDGMAVLEGDILLGPASEVPRRYAPRSGVGAGALPVVPPLALPPLALPPWGSLDGAMPITDTSGLWPGGVIPYRIDDSVDGARRAEIEWAVGEMARAGITVRPAAPRDVDHVVFRDVGDGCNSHLGRVGGAQPINLSGCGQGVTLHELMHAVGFQHEHARSDRDGFVTIVWDEIAPAMRFAFEKDTGTARDAGPYDYASILHYPAHAFSARGNPTIIPHEAGVAIGEHRGLSDLDVAGIRALYAGGAPVAPPQPPAAPPASKPETPATPTPAWSLPIPWPPGLPGFPAAPAQPPGSVPASPPFPGWPQGVPAPPTTPPGLPPLPG